MIERLFRPKRERLWLLFWVNKEKTHALMTFESVGDHTSVSGNAAHYDTITTIPSLFVGFVHTHPGRDTQPSFQDRISVSAWERAIGRPLVNIVVSSNRKSYTILYDGYEQRSSSIVFSWRAKSIDFTPLIERLGKPI